MLIFKLVLIILANFVQDFHSETFVITREEEI